MCSGIQAKAGKCVKCSTCHNNAISTNGRVNSTSWAEEIALPAGCKTETDIEEICMGKFNITNADLITRVSECKELEAKKNLAVSHHKQVVALIPALQNLVDNDIPQKIDTLTKSIADLKADLYNRDVREHEIMVDELKPACQPVVDYMVNQGHGYPEWYLKVGGAHPTWEIVASLKTFVVGGRPDRGSYNYNDEINHWTKKVECGKQIEALTASNKITNIRRQEFEQYKKLKAEAEADLETRKKELEEAKALEPILRQKRETLETEWAGKKDACESDYTKFEVDRTTNMKTCVPTYYDSSCEKECVEIQKTRSEGCGIMEGTMPNDGFKRGGVSGGCLPPFASWVKGPFTYNSQTAQDKGIDIREEQVPQQCARYFEGQSPRHTQRILMRGSMAKQGRWWKWNTRYWILESGTSVRSAVLRYWDSDPNRNRGLKERTTKKIFIWDAKTVVNSGRNCFVLKHFYRNYKLCPSNKGSRNDWVRHLKASIKFPQ